MPRSRSALYHDIGREILERQRQQGWGAKVIEQLATDLAIAFPDMKGFLSRNLKYMKFFAQECPDRQIGQQSAARLPWFHIITLLTKLSDPVLREWYAREALQQSWPRETLQRIPTKKADGGIPPSEVHERVG